jgi:putative tricarboxylic transport membrane protein
LYHDVIQAALQGWGVVLSWPNIIYPIAGMLLAMVFSAFPGLTGATLMALAIPLTAHWDPLPVMLIYGAFLGGATFMGSVTAILFNIPGRPSNAATLLDGHPMARRGEAKTAIGCAAAASALGSTFGVIVLILLIPIMQQVVLAFGPAELLILIIWGLTTIVALSRESMLKGLAIAGFGLMLSFVGFDPRTAEIRYSLGLIWLQDGLPLVPVFLGLYALAELFGLMRERRVTISGSRDATRLSGSLRKGIGAVFRYPGVFLRSSVIGTVIGMVPGVGGTVASFVAYGHAAQLAKRGDHEFGKGDIRGVLAPEAANDAKDGGALVPAMAFGLPGGTGTAMLLAVLAVHGIEPGREMLSSNLVPLFVLIWSLFLTNWLTSLLGITLVGLYARLTTIRTELLIAPLIVIATVGAYLYRGQESDVVIAYVFAGLGYLMKVFDWPRIPMMIALVLGPLFERNLQLVLRLQELGRIEFFARPLVVAFLLLTATGLLVPLFRRNKSHP